MPHPPLNDRKLPHVPGLHLKLVSDGLALLDEQTSAYTVCARKPMRSQLGCQTDRDHDLPGLRLGIAWETHKSSDPALMLSAGARSSADSGHGSASSRNGRQTQTKSYIRYIRNARESDRPIPRSGHIHLSRHTTRRTASMERQHVMTQDGL